MHINLTVGVCTTTKGFDLNCSLPLQHCHGQDFPLTGDSEAVYSSKALWRSVLAVIIQLTGSEQSRPARPFLPPWTEGIRRQEEHLVTPAWSVPREEKRKGSISALGLQTLYRLLIQLQTQKACVFVITSGT